MVEVLTDVPYASNILPVNVPKKKRKNTCRDPMSDMDEEDDEGKSVDS